MKSLGVRMLPPTEIQRAQKSEHILQKKGVGNIALSDFHIHYQTIVIIKEGTLLFRKQKYR